MNVFGVPTVSGMNHYAQRTGLVLIAAAAALGGCGEPSSPKHSKEVDVTPMTAAPEGLALHVGTDAGVFTFVSTGTGWRPTSGRKEEARSVRALALDAERGVLYAGYGMRGAGLDRSTDGGRSWLPVDGWPQDRQAWSIVATPEGPLWVGSQPAELWTRDRGQQVAWVGSNLDQLPGSSEWTFIAPPHEAHLLCLGRHPTSAGQWLAAIEVGGVLHSGDGGSTWTQVSPHWDVHQVLFAADGRWLAATGDGVWHREQGNHEWTQCDAPRGYATGLARSASGTISLALRGRDKAPLWRSTDHGVTWSPVKSSSALPQPGHGVHALAYAPGGSSLYYGAQDGVWRIEGSRAERVVSGLPTVRRVLITHDVE